jgi:hypothetical protein
MSKLSLLPQSRQFPGALPLKFRDLAPHQLACALHSHNRYSDSVSESTDWYEPSFRTADVLRRAPRIPRPSGRRMVTKASTTLLLGRDYQRSNGSGVGRGYEGSRGDSFRREGERGASESQAEANMHPGAFGGYDHGGITRSYSERCHSSLQSGGFHEAGFHEGGFGRAPLTF